MREVSAFEAATIRGAGSTFPAPMYATWADSYQKETCNQVSYQGIGPSGGVKSITAETVEFCASAAPPSDETLTHERRSTFPPVIECWGLAVDFPCF
ncbi:substrate-binding domain-containing protein, partial [Salmonella enterica]|uniref:substrate-binding domain-containing protein n=1 Tax=Salmonella enterica TaxID=28901 RepID=UPI00398C55CF